MSLNNTIINHPTKYFNGNIIIFNLDIFGFRR